MERYDFFRTYGDGTRGPFLGYAMHYERGWMFFPSPALPGRKPSRKYHPTLAHALPHGIRYPDGCESVLNPLVTP